MVTRDGNILLFDNGNFRASPYDGRTPVENEANYSRAVEYAIDENLMTIRQVWQYGKQASPQLFAGFIGDADELAQSGNVLITYGGTSVIDGISTASLGFGPVVARIVEVTRSIPATKVFEVMISDESSWISVYRSERIASLYPAGVTVVTTN